MSLSRESNPKEGEPNCRCQEFHLRGDEKARIVRIVLSFMRPLYPTSPLFAMAYDWARHFR